MQFEPSVCYPPVSSDYKILDFNGQYIVESGFMMRLKQIFASSFLIVLSVFLLVNKSQARDIPFSGMGAHASSEGFCEDSDDKLAVEVAQLDYQRICGAFMSGETHCTSCSEKLGKVTRNTISHDGDSNCTAEVADFGVASGCSEDTSQAQMSVSEVVNSAPQTSETQVNQQAPSVENAPVVPCWDPRSTHKCD